ncbi:MAG: hypothetical protein WBM98_12465, partial [Maribacter sp.]
MKLSKILFALLLFSATMVSAQVKIGENPSTINDASIVELESTTKALVLTRVSTAQMQSITPLRGALIYNLDTQCVHYFNGTQWNNLCSGTGGSYANDFSFVDNGNGTFTINYSDGTSFTTQDLTGPQGDKGDHGTDGDSAYDMAVAEGFVGTEAQWTASLKGDKGDTGEKGEKGIQGEVGPQGLKGDTGDTGATGAQGIQGEVGPQGIQGE